MASLLRLPFPFCRGARFSSDKREWTLALETITPLGEDQEALALAPGWGGPQTPPSSLSPGEETPAAGLPSRLYGQWDRPSSSSGACTGHAAWLGGKSGPQWV